jgi:hypothetical protein
MSKGSTSGAPKRREVSSAEKEFASRFPLLNLSIMLLLWFVSIVFMCSDLPPSFSRSVYLRCQSLVKEWGDKVVMAEWILKTKQHVAVRYVVIRKGVRWLELIFIIPNANV